MEDTYVVRIYRRSQDHPQQVAGIVEEIGVPGNRSFNSKEELWEILHNSAAGIIEKEWIYGSVT